jgi:hypothetical protein
MSMVLFSHADALHETAIESTLHMLGPWFTSVPIILAIVAAIGYLTYLVSGKNVGTTILIESLCLLAVGFITATAYPILSVLAMTIGLVLAGFIAFSGLAAGK